MEDPEGASDGLGQRVIQIGFLAGLLALWAFATSYGAVSPFILPAPAAVAESLWRLLVSGAFLGDLGITLSEVGIAFTASMIAGFVIGYFVSRSAFLVRVFEPLFSSLYAVPVVLFLPLFILFFGLGMSSKVAIGITTSFFPIVLSTIAGFANVDRIYVAAARSMGSSNAKLFWHVLLPAAFPVILTGLRMGFIVAFLSILGAETIASIAGLGHRIVQHAEALETKDMFANIALVIGISTLLNMGLSALERRASARQ